MGTFTPNLNLYKPANGEVGWGDEVDANFDVLDDAAASPTSVQYVKPTGDNAANGTSWATAKEDILSAYDDLPAAGGTIYFLTGSYADSVTTDRGIWIIGNNDAAYASPPTGWRQQKTGGVRIIGVGAEAPVLTTGIPVAGLNAGSATDTAKPAVWLSGTDRAVSFENVHFRYPAVGLRLGVDSNGTTRYNNTAGAGFYNCCIQVNSIAGKGPAVDVGYMYWVWMERCVIGGNAAEAIGSDKRAAILVDCTAAPSVSLFRVLNSNFAGGGFRVKHAGTGGWAFNLENILHEGNFADAQPPTFEIVAGSNTGRAYLKGLELADTVEPIILIRTPDNLTASQVEVVDSGGGQFIGPMTIHGRYAPTWDTTESSLAGARQLGFWQGRVSAQHDSARRTFAPQAVRFLNKANQDVSAWSGLGGTATVATGKVAPDGTTNAARLTSSSGNTHRAVVETAQTFAVGDWVVGGCWVRSVTTPAALAPLVVMSAASNNIWTYTGISDINVELPSMGEGEWEWISFADKVETVGTASSSLYMRLYVGNGFPCEYYAPVLMYITAANAVADSEMLEMAQHLSSFSNTASVGQLSFIGGQSLHLPKGYIEMGEMTAPSAGATNYGRIYMEDNGSGKTRLVAKFPTGSAVVIATEP